MAHSLLIVVRGLVICFGLLLLYIAFFLHEDEEGSLQNRLEELWVRVDDMQKTAMAKHTAFLKTTLSLFNRGFDSLFGNKIFSARAVAITLCFSEASFFLVMTRLFRVYPSPHNATLRAIACAALLVLLGTSTSLPKTRKTRVVWVYTVIVIASLALIPLYPLMLGGLALPWHYSLVFWAIMGWKFEVDLIVMLIGGIVCDILFIALNRTIIRVAANINGSTQILVMLFANFVIAGMYVAPYVFWGLLPRTRLENVLSLISSTNFITAFLACSIAWIMAVALLHRLFWPLISRPIYSLTRFGVARKPTLLLSTSIVLLAWAIPAWEPLLAKLKEFK